MAGPLDGLVVVDASWGMPGALAGMLLADYGARVIKVERPGGGPDVASMSRKVWDRGKWSAEVDLGAADEAERLAGLLAGADVFVESFGAGRAAALGLGYEDLAARHPHLVYCSISAYGTDGPLVDRPGYDALVAARFGLMAELVGHRDGPIFLGHPAVSTVTAFLATIGILGGLRARAETGAGQLVDTSLLDGTLSLMSMNWWWNERDLSYLARTGTESGFGHNRLITDLFECGDGQYLMMHTGGEGGFKRTMDILGLGDKVRTVEGLEMRVPLDEDEYHLARHVAPEAFKARPRDEWIKLFHEADIAALPVLQPEETHEDEQVAFAKVMVEVPDEEHGTLRQVGPTTHFAAAPAGPTRPAPPLGRDTALLAELLDPAARASATGRSATLAHPLEGIRVLDFSAFYATAFGARLLSDLGADVIKVEPLYGDQMRPLADLFEGAQRGKRNLAIDLRTPEGREIIAKLVASTDVVMHNLRPGKAEKIGIGYEDLRRIRPDLVYCYLPGFGSSGPKADLKSFAPLVSGFAGLLYEGAGVGNPPIRRVLGNEDLYNGFAGATAALMALYHRDRTGKGQYLENPQLHSSLFVMSHHCTDAEGTPLTDLVLDADQTGWSPLFRLYRTADGWICLACVGEAAYARLASALELPELTTDEAFAQPGPRAEHADALADLIGSRLAARTSEEAAAALDAASVPCEIPLGYPLMPEFLWDEWALSSGRVFEHHHPEHGWVREVGNVVRLSATPPANKGPSPRLGQHTAEILAEVGYSTDDISALTGRVVLVAAEETDDTDTDTAKGE